MAWTPSKHVRDTKGRESVKRRALIVVIAVGLALSTASAALAAQPTTPRQDAYFETWCNLGEDNEFLGERLDAHAGGHANAVEHYNQNNPFGDVCVELGPFFP